MVVLPFNSSCLSTVTTEADKTNGLIIRPLYSGVCVCGYAAKRPAWILGNHRVSCCPVSPHHKNSASQGSGLQEDNLLWMSQLAEKNLSDHAKSGGLILDEMAIQPGVDLVINGEHLDIVGLVEMGTYNAGNQAGPHREDHC